MNYHILISLGFLSVQPIMATVTPYAHYLMGDGIPSTNGGKNLPWDASGNVRHMTGAATGTPAISPNGGPGDDAYTTFNGSDQYFFGTNTAAAWNPPEDNVGVEAWVRTSNLAQVNRHIFGTGDNTKGINLGYDAGGGRGWFGAVANVDFAGIVGTGNYTAGQWIHLASVRSGGTTTFYIGGIPSGTTAAVPSETTRSSSRNISSTKVHIEARPRIMRRRDSSVPSARRSTH